MHEPLYRWTLLIRKTAEFLWKWIIQFLAIFHVFHFQMRGWGVMFVGSIFIIAVHWSEFDIIMGLNRSVALDTFQHNILLNRLCDKFGVTLTALLTDDLHQKQTAAGEGRSTVVVNRADLVQNPARFRERTNPVCIIHVSNCRYNEKSWHQLSTVCPSRWHSVTHRLAKCQHWCRIIYPGRLSMDVKHWYVFNGLQLNADKSERLLVGTAYQLQAASAIKSVSVAGSSLSLTEEMKTLGMILNSRLSFNINVSSMIRCASDPWYAGSAQSNHGTKASLQSCTNETGEARTRPSVHWRPSTATTTSLAARRKSNAIQNCIADLQGTIDFDAIIPIVNYYFETTNRTFSFCSLSVPWFLE